MNQILDQNELDLIESFQEILELCPVFQEPEMKHVFHQYCSTEHWKNAFSTHFSFEKIDFFIVDLLKLCRAIAWYHAVRPTIEIVHIDGNPYFKISSTGYMSNVYVRGIR